MEPACRKDKQKLNSTPTRGDRARQKSAQQEHKQRQRAEIYALNKVMTELEQQQFESFCLDRNGAPGDPDAEPTVPELGVLSSVFEGAVVSVGVKGHRLVRVLLHDLLVLVQQIHGESSGSDLGFRGRLGSELGLLHGGAVRVGPFKEAHLEGNVEGGRLDTTRSDRLRGAIRYMSRASNNNPARIARMMIHTGTGNGLSGLFHSTVVTT
ncbi:Small vasohibin-binding protein [Liparis tanakae]|uniref:Small vasohibin-binding protein n=1 Tax=Liparis tanakae TaxID=230148 RepID=A0A4Z2IMW8_9TELE|nr:Small vasohibin-binding protein [Liparis tanakae]